MDPVYRCRFSRKVENQALKNKENKILNLTPKPCGEQN
jgi:hypothetical protein